MNSVNRMASNNKIPVGSRTPTTVDTKNPGGAGRGKVSVKDDEKSHHNHESHRLLPSSSSGSSPLYHDTLLNDLSYSDDDETDAYWKWDSAELGLGVSGSISSPDTAQLLDDIQNAIFPTQHPMTRLQQQEQQQQQQQQQQQLHLMHPLATGETGRSSDNDENSYLEYSITSSHADETRNSTGSLATTESDIEALLAFGVAAAKNNASYGSLDPRSKPRAAAVTFRPPSSVFDHSPRSEDVRRPPQKQQKQQKRSRRKSTASSRSRTRPGRADPSPPSSSPSARATDRDGRPIASTGHDGRGGASVPPPVTPFPSAISESPVTSATATDDTGRCSDENADPTRCCRSPVPSDGEAAVVRDRVAGTIGGEAGRRARRHRRLRRIKKAAEAREAAVREVRGEAQRPGGCNDAAFAFAFLCQFLLVSMSAVAFGPGALNDRIYEMADGDLGTGEGGQADYNPFAGLQTDDIIITNGPLLRAGGGSSGGGGAVEDDVGVGLGISHIDYINVIQLVCIVGGYASLCSLLALGFMMMLSRNLLHATLLFTIGMSLLWTVLGWTFSQGYILPVTGAVALTLSSAYTWVVWDRIPFATTNISVALQGMRSTLDIPCVGVCVLAVAFLWTIWWICAFVGTFDFLNDDEKEFADAWMSFVVAFFLFSYYWTFQVIKGISKVTVASIIGTWWDVSDEEAPSLCSNIIHGSVPRTIAQSFGSICLGSLIIGPCIILMQISTFFRLAMPKLNKLTNSPKRPQKDDLVSRNVNQWSFTYIGLYGYKFWESGSKASQLFEARGWTHAVSDDLIMTAMFMSSMIIGGTTACLGLIVEEMDGYSLTSLNKPIPTAFLICLFLGFFLSSMFLSIIEGSVSAILVCYAAAPVEFHANHHKLSEEMKSVWKHFWLRKPMTNNNGRR